MQRKRVVALAPTIADPRPLLDHQRVDPKLIEARGYGETGLGAADHQKRLDRDPHNARLCAGRSSQLSPPKLREYAAPDGRLSPICSSKPSSSSRQVEEPGSIIPVGVGGQPKRSLAAPDFRLEAYDGFNTFAPEPCDQARWRSVRAYPEAPRFDSLLTSDHCPRDRHGTNHRRQMPRKCQDIAPVSVFFEEGGDRSRIAFRSSNSATRSRMVSLRSKTRLRSYILLINRIHGLSFGSSRLRRRR